MQRVMVIGCCGAGKSVFSRKLHAITGLELIHLDQQYWKAGWQEPEPAAWAETVKAHSRREQWIMDGNYGGTMDIRIARADTIIYFDYPTLKCLWRITKRILKYWGKERPDMPPGCRERFDLDFYHYVATFNLTRRKKLLDKIGGSKSGKSVYILRNDRESARFLDGLRRE